MLKTCTVDNHPVADEDIVGYAVFNDSPDIHVFCTSHGAAFNAALRIIRQETQLLQM